MLHLLERKLTFKPTWDDHGGLNDIQHQRVIFGHEFGLNLDGIFVDNGSDSIVIFSHGNKHNITKFRDHYKLFAAIGQSFFTFDYPGYGRSRGTPSEPLVYASAQAAYAYVRNYLGRKPDKIVAYGCSMGGAVAIDLCQHSEVACLITESTFTNSWEMARHLYPYLPVWYLLPKRFQNDRKISNIRAPILLIHGENDPIVPVTMASTLLKAATAPTQLIVVPKANHINSLSIGSESLQMNIRNFISRYVAR